MSPPCSLGLLCLLVSLASSLVPKKATTTTSHLSTSSSIKKKKQPLSYAFSAEPALALTTSITHRDHFDRTAWNNGWSTVQEEACYQVEDASFPFDLSGTFYQNGPGLFARGDEHIMHPFDGDGMVRAVTFHKGKAWFRNRFVRTPGFVKEQEADKICYRGVFGTAKDKGSFLANFLDVRTKNVANTHVLAHRNKLFALWEADQPVELDPVTLETIGTTMDYGKRYAAHYKIDPQTGTICNFCIHFAWPNPSAAHKLTVFEHDMETGDLLYQRTYRLPGLAIGHDFCITENYFCFFRSPTYFDPIPFLMGRKGPAQCFHFDETAKSATLHLVKRGVNEDSVISLDIPPCFCFHICNAFEQGEELLIDVVMAPKMFMADTSESSAYPERPIWETVDFRTDVPKFEMVRYRINLKTQEFVSKQSMSQGCGNLDFPCIHPAVVGRPYQYSYVITSPTAEEVSAMQGLAKIDVQKGQVVEKWLPQPHEFLSEVVVAPRSNDSEEDAYLIGYLMDGREKKSSIVVFDAASISQGPISQAKLKQLMPHSLHGCFVPDMVPELTESVLASFQNE